MKTVAVFFGGRSTEHDVSVVTAIASVIKPLELSKQYKVVPVYITREGSWYSDERLKDIAVFSSGKIDGLLKQLKPVGVRVGDGLSLVHAGSLGRVRVQKIDIAFPSMHGTYGEDGTLMGLLELSGIPYVGCDMPSSVLAMDKVLAKIVAQEQGILTPKFLHFSRSQITNDTAAAATMIEKSLKYPLFVKPAHLGSSIGISRVKDKTELVNALEVAAHYDDKIVVEEGVQNLIEVTLPVMGNDKLVPALLERPLTSAEDFFDFDTKYLRGGKKGGQKSGGKGKAGAQGYSELPAKIPDALYKQAVTTGLMVYRALGCSGTARIDMLIDEKTGNVYFNEVNPLPGSLYMHNWRQAGVSSIELVTRLIVLAEEKHAQKQSLTTSFGTNYLKQF